MSVVLKCRCGWEGAVDLAVAGMHPHCVACGALLPLPETPPIPGPGATAAPDATGGTARSPTPFPGAVRYVAVPNRWIAGAKSRATAAWDWLARVLKPVWHYIRDASLFYWRNRGALRAGARVWLTEYLPLLDPSEDIRRELRMPLAEEEGLHEEAGVWRIDLPARCVVCAGAAPGEWIDEPRTVLDPYGLIAAPLAGLAAGVILGWWYHSLSWLVIAPFAGMLCGYALRKNVEFLVRYKRCPRHAENRSIPELAVLHGRLILRLGSREVKLAYLRKEHDHPPPGEMVPPPETQSVSPPETIALAEIVDPHDTIVPERTGHRLPEADDASIDTDPYAKPLAPPAETRPPSRPAADENEGYGVEGYDAHGDAMKPNQSPP